VNDSKFELNQILCASNVKNVNKPNINPVSRLSVIVSSDEGTVGANAATGNAAQSTAIQDQLLAIQSSINQMQCNINEVKMNQMIDRSTTTIWIFKYESEANWQATRANDDVGNGGGIKDAGWRHYRC
jgi:TolA-binding protein